LLYPGAILTFIDALAASLLAAPLAAEGQQTG